MALATVPLAQVFSPEGRSAISFHLSEIRCDGYRAFFHLEYAGAYPPNRRWGFSGRLCNLLLLAATHPSTHILPGGSDWSDTKDQPSQFRVSYPARLMFEDRNGPVVEALIAGAGVIEPVVAVRKHALMLGQVSSAALVRGEIAITLPLALHGI